MYVIWSEGVGCDGCDQGRVDAAGQANADVGETALGHVVAGGGHEHAVQLSGRVEWVDRCGHDVVASVHRPGDNDGRQVGLRCRNTGHVDVDDHDSLFEPGGPGDYEACRVGDHGSSVEHQLILATDQVHVHDGQPGRSRRGGHHRLALSQHAAVVRRTVDGDQELRSTFYKAAHGAVGDPEILTDHEADPDASDLVEPQRLDPGDEVACLVEHVVVR